MYIAHVSHTKSTDDMNHSKYTINHLKLISIYTNLSKIIYNCLCVYVSVHPHGDE